MNSDDRHIRQVIEPGKSDPCDPITPQGRRLRLSPHQAFHYNDHPDAIIEDFDRSEYRAVLREIEQHLITWEGQQTPEQAEWIAQVRRRGYRSTGEAANAIVAALHF
ncbi:MAG TPA: hypothetical protein VIJ70_01360 [Gaiellaceae bacterium]